MWTQRLNMNWMKANTYGVKIRLSLFANLCIKGDQRHCNAVMASETLQVGFLRVHKASLLLSCMFGISYHFYVVTPVNAIGFRGCCDLLSKCPQGFIKPRRLFKMSEALLLHSTLIINKLGRFETVLDNFHIVSSKGVTQCNQTVLHPRDLQSDIGAESVCYQRAAFVSAPYLMLKR